MDTCAFAASNTRFQCPVVLVREGDAGYLTSKDFQLLEKLNPELYAEVVEQEDTPLGIGGFL